MAPLSRAITWMDMHSLLWGKVLTFICLSIIVDRTSRFGIYFFQFNVCIVVWILERGLKIAEAHTTNGMVLLVVLHRQVIKVEIFHVCMPCYPA